MPARRVVAVVQARMGSTRLPGKVLELLNKTPALGWTVAGCRLAKTVDETWIATTVESRDDAIADYAKALGVPCHRGSEDDVLERIHDCAVIAGAQIVVRITGDLPFVDPDVIDQVVMLMHRNKRLAYASNVDPATWPDGLDVQACTMEALRSAHAHAIRPSDRDTVMQYIVRNRDQFDAANLTCPIPGLQSERWVLDTKEDLQFCQSVASRCTNHPSYIDILQILEDFPQYRSANKHLTRNERFYAQVAREGLGKRRTDRSLVALHVARDYQPYGASTYSKSFVAYGKDAPLYVSHGDGANVYDVDGNDYLDMTGGLCTTILGYRDPDVDAAIRQQMDSGISFPLGTNIEIALAQRLAGMLSDKKKMHVVFGKNGSDVTTLAVRIARTYTERKDVMVLDSGYHGWHDWILGGTQRGYGIVGDPHVLRVPQDIAQITMMLETHEFAAVIIEPEQDATFLRTLAAACKATKTMLVADEIVTFLRYPRYFAHLHAGFEPDMVCIGKSLGNGMPISALIGTDNIVSRIAPQEKRPNCFYSGTFFGETLSIAAAHATLTSITARGVHKKFLERAYEINSIANMAVQKHKSGIKILPPPLNRIEFPSSEVANMFRAEMAHYGVLIYAMHNNMVCLTDADMRRLAIAYDLALGKIASGRAMTYKTEATGIMRR